MKLACMYCLAEQLTLLSVLTVQLGSSGAAGGFSCDNYASCRHRCGQTTVPPYTCACDSDCDYFGDCCFDYKKVCSQAVLPPILLNTSGIFTCRGQGTAILGVYQISHCLKTHSFVCPNSLLCELISEPPAFHPDWKIFFKNQFCLICWVEHNQGDEAQMLVGRDLENRGCLASLKQCSKKNASNYLRAKCNSYVKPVLVRVKSVNETKEYMYRNVDCYRCDLSSSSGENSISLKSEEDEVFISCLNPFVTTGLQLSHTHQDMKPVSLSVGHPLRVQTGTELKVEDIVEGVLKNSERSSIPDSISVLINYGPDNNNILYSTDSDKHDCQATQLWDPFFEMCRDVYCATDLVMLETLECKGTTGNLSSDNAPHVSFPTDEIMLNMTIELSVFNQSLAIKEIIEILMIEIPTVLANDMIIDESRIKNVSLKYKDVVERHERTRQEILIDVISASYMLKQSGMWEHSDELSSTEMTEVVDSVMNRTNNQIILMEIKFVLEEGSSDEKSTDEIVISMTNFIQENSFILEFSSMSLKVVSLRERNIYTEEEINQWCRDGDLRSYFSGDFELQIRNMSEANSSTSVLELVAIIKKTGKIYHTKDYVANILLQSSANNVNQANKSGIITVCENRAFINDTKCLLRVKLNQTSFKWSDNGTLTYDEGGMFGIKHILHRWEYYLTVDGMVEVCVNLANQSFGLDLVDLAEIYLSFFLHILSIVLLFITLFTYAIFGELRNLPGCNLMCLAFSEFMSQLIFLLGEREEVQGNVCKVIAIFLHFTYLTVFFWNNVMAWDIYKTFGQRTILSHIRSKKEHLPKYMTYAYGVPLCIVLFSLTIEYTDLMGDFSIGYGVNNCWIGEKSAIFVFFCLPMLFVILSNTLLYILTVISINYVSTVVESTRHKDRGKSDLMIYVRIFSVLGFTWIFGIIAFFFKCDCLTRRIILFLFVIFNSMQGVFLFSVFTANSRVVNLYGQLITRFKEERDLSQEVRRRVKSQKRKRALQIACEVNTKKSDDIIPTVSGAVSTRNLSCKEVPRLWIWSPSLLRTRIRKTSNESMTSTSTTSTTAVSPEPLNRTPSRQSWLTDLFYAHDERAEGEGGSEA